MTLSICGERCRPWRFLSSRRLPLRFGEMHSARALAGANYRCFGGTQSFTGDQGWLNFVADGGLRHRTLEWHGDGPLVLFVHANSLCAGVWAPVVRRISDIHAIAYDQRGHGDTDVPQCTDAYQWVNFARDFSRVVAATVEKHGRAIDACVTHSFAGDCALMALAERSMPIGRLILLDPVLADAAGAASGAMRLARGTRRLGEKEAHGFPSAKLVADAFERSLLKSLARDSLHTESKAAFAQFGVHQDVDGRWRLNCSRDVEARIYQHRIAIAEHLARESIEVGVDLVFSAKRRGRPEDHDALMNRDLQEANRVLARCGSSSALLQLDAVGHFLVLEAPDLVAETLRDLILKGQHTLGMHS